MAAKGGLKAKEMPASTRTVVVACKIPNGLVLQAQRPMQRFEDTRDGPVPRSYNVFTGPRFRVRGPAYPVGTLPKGFEAYKPRPNTEGGYALTTGVPVDLWNTWFEQNKNADFVTSEMIAAYASVEDATAACREREELLSGLEPISTDEDANGKLTDPRVPKPLSAMLSEIGEEKRGATA